NSREKGKLPGEPPACPLPCCSKGYTPAPVFAQPRLLAGSKLLSQKKESAPKIGHSRKNRLQLLRKLPRTPPVSGTVLKTVLLLPHTPPAPLPGSLLAENLIAFARRPRTRPARPRVCGGPCPATGRYTVRAYDTTHRQALPPSPSSQDRAVVCGNPGGP